MFIQQATWMPFSCFPLCFQLWLQSVCVFFSPWGLGALIGRRENKTLKRKRELDSLKARRPLSRAHFLAGLWCVKKEGLKKKKKKKSEACRAHTRFTSQAFLTSCSSLLSSHRGAELPAITMSHETSREFTTDLHCHPEIPKIWGRLIKHGEEKGRVFFFFK